MDYAFTESGLIMPEYLIRKPRRPIAFDFFAGAGGFSLGFLQAGYEVIGANEFNENAAMTYMVNLGGYPMQIYYIEGEKEKNRLEKAIARMWGLKGEYVSIEEINEKYGTVLAPERLCFAGSARTGHADFPGVKNFWFGDVRKLKGKDILDALGLKQGDIDVVMGGPPCQGFSKSGKRQIGDPRNNLIYEYGRMIVELQPKTFVMEEVPDVVNFFDPDGVPVLDKFCKILEDGDFGKWDMIKQALVAHAGSGAVIKDKLHRHKTEKPQRKKTQNANSPELFEEDGQ